MSCDHEFWIKCACSESCHVSEHSWLDFFYFFIFLSHFAVSDVVPTAWEVQTIVSASFYFFVFVLSLWIASPERRNWNADPLGRSEFQGAATAIANYTYYFRDVGSTMRQRRLSAKMICNRNQLWGTLCMGAVSQRLEYRPTRAKERICSDRKMFSQVAKCNKCAADVCGVNLIVLYGI